VGGRKGKGEKQKRWHKGSGDKGKKGSRPVVKKTNMVKWGGRGGRNTIGEKKTTTRPFQ